MFYLLGKINPTMKSHIIGIKSQFSIFFFQTCTLTQHICFTDKFSEWESNQNEIQHHYNKYIDAATADDKL